MHTQAAKIQEEDTNTKIKSSEVILLLGKNKHQEIPEFKDNSAFTLSN